MIPAKHLNAYTEKCSVFDEIDCEIMYKSFHNQSKLTKFVTGNVSVIKQHYQDLGYTVTSDSLSPLLLTISWPTR